MSFQEGLEDDRGMDRVQWCRLFNVIPRRSKPEIVLSRIFFKILQVRLRTVVVIVNWVSEASPTLGCSIEISRDIYIFMCLSWSKMRTQNYVAKHAHAQGQFGAVKTDQ